MSKSSLGDFIKKRFGVMSRFEVPVSIEDFVKIQFSGKEAPKLIYAYSDTTIKEVLRLLDENNLLSLPIFEVEGQKYERCELKGRVSLFEIMQYFYHPRKKEKTHAVITLEKPISKVLHFTEYHLQSQPIHGFEFGFPFVLKKNQTKCLLLKSLYYPFSEGLHRLLIEYEPQRYLNVSQSDVISFLGTNAFKLLPFDPDITLKESGIFSKTDDFVTIRMNDKVSDSFVRLSRVFKNIAAVVDDRGKLITSLSASDLRKLNDFLILDLENYTVEKFLLYNRNEFKKPTMVKKSDQFVDVINLIAKQRLHHVWVVDAHQKPIDLISLTDIFRIVSGHEMRLDLLDSLEPNEETQKVKTSILEKEEKRKKEFEKNERTSSGRLGKRKSSQKVPKKTSSEKSIKDEEKKSDQIEEEKWLYLQDRKLKEKERLRRLDDERKWEYLKERREIEEGRNKFEYGEFGQWAYLQERKNLKKELEEEENREKWSYKRQRKNLDEKENISDKEKVIICDDNDIIEGEKKDRIIKEHEEIDVEKGKVKSIVDKWEQDSPKQSKIKDERDEIFCLRKKEDEENIDKMKNEEERKNIVKHDFQEEKEKEPWRKEVDLIEGKVIENELQKDNEKQIEKEDEKPLDRHEKKKARKKSKKEEKRKSKKLHDEQKIEEKRKSQELDRKDEEKILHDGIEKKGKRKSIKKEELTPPVTPRQEINYKEKPITHHSKRKNSAAV